MIQDARLDEAGIDVHKGRAWVLLGELLAGEVVHDDGVAKAVAETEMVL